MNAQKIEQTLGRYATVIEKPLVLRARLLVFFAALMLIPTFLLPLWEMHFVAQQYPEGLDLYIYSNTIEGGDDGNDLTEINVLNHYIGMAELRAEDFVELRWIPLVVGLVGILTLRAAVVGSVSSVIDLIVMSLYFSLFSLISFWLKLREYGHNLDPRAAVRVDPFTPPVFGYRMVGQFHVWAYPHWGTLFFTLFGVLLVLALILSIRQWVRATKQP